MAHPHDQITQLLAGGVREQVFPGAVWAIGDADGNVAFLAIARQYAKDGKLQGMLEHLHIPHTGSGVPASALATRKPAKTTVAAHGVSVLPGRQKVINIVVASRPWLIRLG
ncbi:D-alanine-D-alanine ligase-like ATP-grasp enzyme [Streptosporangium album]|uniref:D-alanine-D-alanine ligase-like ATP-grasp enzyme n=1 Tax=Streptosporangium album TaxID=47479 RepID=A0A7W7RYX2_9ACTN|nr:hypothetical protein [Streptosporangium album]MBB4940637.1 D-alanine-D-alanine ligase-like ATP-grasp enzyme [Streptosporangium album]